MQRNVKPAGRGLSLLELLAVVAILGVLAVVAVTRFGEANDEGLKNACYVNCRDIETQVQLWYRDQGVWPATDLHDIGSDASHFPQGLPTCPVDGSAYTLDSATHRVAGHTH